MSYLLTQLRSELIKIQTHSAPQHDHLNFSFVKDIHVNGGNLALKSCKAAICQSTFFRDTLYVFENLLFIVLYRYSPEGPCYFSKDMRHFYQLSCFLVQKFRS